VEELVFIIVFLRLKGRENKAGEKREGDKCTKEMKEKKEWGKV
jgi:hypothetical protein